MDWQKIIRFDEMITSRLIQIIYLLGAGLISLVGLVFLFRTFLLGLAIIIFGNLVWRINCELIILLFKIKDNLAEIKNNLDTNSPQESDSGTIN